MLKTYYKAIKRIFLDHGLKGFFVISQHTLEYIYSKFIKRGNFRFNNHIYPYFYHWYGHTYRSERTVEIPLALDFLEKHKWREKKTILEIGDVLSHYTKSVYIRHDIVDKYAHDNPKVINEDVVNFKSKKKYDIAISISTMEHVGWDEKPKEKNKFLRGLNNVSKLLKTNGKMFVTVPLGYNKDLDKYFERGNFTPFKTYFLKRVSKDNRWKQVKQGEISEYTYGKPYPFGNVIMILMKE